MKPGLGLYRNMLTPQNFRFAKQAGATHIVAHWVDYFSDAASLSTGSGGSAWGISNNSHRLWTYEELRDLRLAVEAEGLKLAAIENFDPSHWYDILLDGPQKKQQLENIKTIIRNMGKAEIPCMGYCFTVVGVWGRIEGEFARGNARSVGYVSELVPEQTPIPRGTVWNMIYDPDAPTGDIGTVTEEEMWQRLTDFLREIVPVAEEAGVRLAAHPDDPPLPVMRNAARLIYHPDRYQRLLDIVPNYYNALEFCLGTLSEMAGGDVYQAVDHYSKQDRLAYIHMRNVRGKVPDYHEVFIDDGDTDMFKILSLLKQNNFDGVIIPDHTPQMVCDAPWHAGMAYALGWMRGAIRALEK